MTSFFAPVLLQITLHSAILYGTNYCVQYDYVYNGARNNFWQRTECY